MKILGCGKSVAVWGCLGLEVAAGFEPRSVRSSLPHLLRRVPPGPGSLPGGGTLLESPSNIKETELWPSPRAVSVLAGFPLGEPQGEASSNFCPSLLLASWTPRPPGPAWHLGERAG